jgi:SPP1 gp7 family putative phage head morphogenesis protein
LKTFDRFETKVLAATDKINIEKKIDKTFGDFLRDMFNSVNTKQFASQVKRYLKADLIAGMVSAEKETGMDIGFTQAYDDKLDKLQGQQVDGYTINGTKWPGIKGVTKEIQAKVIMAVQAGIKEGKDLDGIKADIKSEFDGFSDWRSEMIGRTETSRIINEGKLLGYKETGIKGKKVWTSALDDRTSDICRRLNGQERELDEPFKDPGTMKDYPTPPGHPNCRSVLIFRPS